MFAYSRLIALTLSSFIGNVPAQASQAAGLVPDLRPGMIARSVGSGGNDSIFRSAPGVSGILSLKAISQAKLVGREVIESEIIGRSEPVVAKDAIDGDYDRAQIAGYSMLPTTVILREIITADGITVHSCQTRVITGTVSDVKSVGAARINAIVNPALSVVGSFGYGNLDIIRGALI